MVADLWGAGELHNGTGGSYRYRGDGDSLVMFETGLQVVGAGERTREQVRGAHGPPSGGPKSQPPLPHTLSARPLAAWLLPDRVQPERLATPAALLRTSGSRAREGRRDTDSPPGGPGAPRTGTVGVGSRGRGRDTGSRSGALQSDPTSPGEGGPRGPPPASPTRTPATGVNAEGEPSPHGLPQDAASTAGTDGEPPQLQPRRPREAASDTHAPAAGSLRGSPQTCPRRRVRGGRPPPPPLRPGAHCPTTSPVRKKASTSESAAPPSSDAPSGGFMTGGRASAGSRAPAKPGAEGGAAPSGRRARRPWPRSRRPRGSRARARGGGAAAGVAEPFSGGGVRRAGGACRRSPHGPPPSGRWPPAVWPGPGAGVPAACAPAVPGSGSCLSSPPPRLPWLLPDSRSLRPGQQ
nr:proline-rich proteoglycan 2-like [Meriones unguiculatus]